MDRDERLQELIKLLLANPQGLTVSEIVRHLGVNRSTIMRSLPKLEEEGTLLWEDNTGKLGLVDRKKLPKRITQLEKPLQRLGDLLERRDNAEAEYQQLFQNYPWILGTQYRTIERHSQLDDENIPDFTGIRAWDDYRDIFEIKPPFMKIFRADGEFTSDFNESWNQAEKYLDFVQIERDYLQRKGLRFNNPRCVLILGFGLTEDEIKKIGTKHTMNSLIQVHTYDNILAFMHHTIELVRKLQDEDDRYG